MPNPSILFSGPMVRAILDGSKTQTRRLNPRGIKVGDVVWVRETWAEDAGRILYRATSGHHGGGPVTWKPSIFMSRRASRIDLEILSVRQERLQSISPEDAIAEGIECPAPIPKFAQLWDSINGKKQPWSSNPTVTVFTFRRIKP